MARLDLLKGWLDRPTDVRRMGTARVEMAARRRIERAWHLTLEDLAGAPRFDLPARHRHGREQRLRAGVLRMSELFASIAQPFGTLRSFVRMQATLRLDDAALIDGER